MHERIVDFTPPPVYRPRPDRNWFGVIAKWIVGLLLVAIAVVLIYAGYVVINVAKISTQPWQISGLTTDVSGRVNVLVLGVGDPGHAGEGLTDTMMVLSLDTRTKRVAQISIPRDLRVTIPGYGKGKINVAHSVGGVPLAEQVVANTLGIPIDYYVRTNFTGLKQMVDAVGGIDVDVKQRLMDTEYPCDDDQYKVCGMDIKPGLQHMDGSTALKYARCRKGTCGDDFGRAARQQEVMNLVRSKLVQWELALHPTELGQVVTALHTGIQTDMSASQMVLFGRSWQEAQNNHPISLVLSYADGGLLVDDPSSSDLVPAGGDFSRIQKRVADIFAESR